MDLRRCFWLLALFLPAAAGHAAPTILCGHQLLQGQRERNALLPKPKPLKPGQLLRSRQATSTSVAGNSLSPKVGDRSKFWVLDFTGHDGSDRSIKRYRITASLKLTTTNAYFYVEDGARIAPRALARLGQIFEEKILPQEHRYFGSPWSPGIDSDSKVTILLANIKSPGGSNPLGPNDVTIGGYFNDEDEYPNDDRHPYSNEREMVVLNAALDVSSRLVLEVLAHEYQHLIHWNHDRGEELWVNEGLSMVAPTVAGLGADLQSSLGNAILAYGLDYQNSLTQWGDRGAEEIEGDYGAAGLFFTYLGERFGGAESYRHLVSRPERGIEGVLVGLKEAGYPIQFADLFTRWTVANLADDARLGNPPGNYGYQAADLKKLRGSVTALHELLPDLIPALFQPVARVSAYPAQGGATLSPQSVHYIELTGTGTLNLTFDGGGRPFEAFVLARMVDDTYQLFPVPLDPESRLGSLPLVGLGSTISRVCLIVTHVSAADQQPAEYRYEATIE